MPGAEVQLDGGGAHASVAADSAGRFTFEDLPAGEYTVRVSYRGGTAASSKPAHVPGDGKEVILRLSDDGALLVESAEKSESSSGGEQLSAKAVSSLPLNKRDFSQLLLLAAGTMTDTNGAANFTQQFAINGQRGTAAVFAMDGADSTDPEMGGATFTNFNVDAVQEIQSSSGWMPAEIGRGAAGFSNIVTRSGTSALHGSAFEFLRNSALDARNFFDRRSIAEPNRIPPFIRNEFGFTNGGPVVIPRVYDGRNRTFYFIEYQGFRQVYSATEVIPVPSLAERAGRDATAFPGDVLLIPVDPRIAKVLARYPLPNDPQGPDGARTYASSSKVTTVSNQASARIDHRISSRSQLLARFTMENTAGPLTNPSQTVIDPSFAVGFTDQQRNAVLTYTRTLPSGFVSLSSVSYTRATPAFPTVNHTDPALTFGDGLYEAFNAAGGSVQNVLGNLFQVRQDFTWIRGKHTFKAGGEVRANRDTTLFGITPNGQYQFGGGTAYSPVAIHSLSGGHDINAGDPLPDALAGFLTASAFSYTASVAPPQFAQGSHIGESAIRRDAYNVYAQDSWKISSRLLLNYGLRYEVVTPIREGSRRTSAPVVSGPGAGTTLTINPDPGYQLDKSGWGPRAALEWRAAANTVFRAGAGITTLLTNLYQDNALTGGTPFVITPRITAAPGERVPYGKTILPADLPQVYTPAGALIFASGDSKDVPGNTVMDVMRFEEDLAALAGDRHATPLSVFGISSGFRNGYIGTWTAGIEHKLRGAAIGAAYVGTAGVKLPVMDFPNAYAGADPAFAPLTRFDAAGQITGGYGLVSLMANHSHSSYHSLQASVQKELTSHGLGFQASYTFSKSIDDTSAVIGGFISGYSGAVSQTAPQDPFNARADRGPSSFDVRSSLSFNIFQDLHADRLAWLRPLGRTATAGWQVMGIGTFMSGLPFTVYSGVQQTGVGANGTDRPDQTDVPDLSTSRAVREDYFGRGADNASFFHIPSNPGHFGSLGRNTFRGPAFRDLDIALIKDAPLGTRAGREMASLQFRAEFFNLLNTVNFGLPSNIVLGPGFGEITRTASNSRQIQFSLKLIY